VVERNFLPAGASTKNAGFACFGSVTELMDDLTKMSENEVWETVANRWEGLQYLRELIGDSNLDFQGLGSWDLIRNDENSTLQKSTEFLPYLNQKIEAITGVQNVYSLDKNVKEKFGFQSIQSGFYNQLEGQIDTGKMMVKFHQLLAEHGIHLLTGIEIMELYSSENEVLIQSNIGDFKASKVAICVNGFAQKFLPKNDILPARAQVIITKKIDNLPFKGTFHFQEGYYYFRNIHDRVLFGGGRNLDFEGETTTKIENSEIILNQLKKLLREIILPNTPFEIDYSWAGIMGVGKTKKPIIELVKPNIAVGVRMGGMGVAIGSIVGKNVAQLL
jgi:glycine/D-amino acid oxidase-like deaminating enzyme